MSGPAVVYVLGRGRSGSTFLEALIAERSGATLLGEARLWPIVYRADHLCSCGKAKTDCPFWAPVIESLPSRARGAFERTVARSFLASLAMPVALARRLYADVWAEVPGFYARIGAVHNVPVVLDSSKNPAYARLLASTMDVRMIHVLRHPLGVVYSWKRQRAKADEAALYAVKKPLLLAALEWTGSNLLASWVRVISPGRSMLVRYETLGDEAVLGKLDAFVGASGGSGEAHAMAGNPGDAARAGAFRLDEGWRDGLSLWEKLLCGAVTMPLYALYIWRAR